jgi:ubiquinone/menaquinone biosynthesis C-methylase UbiE
MHDDPFASFKAAQREGWALFAPLESVTTLPAAQLVRFGGVTAHDQVLDVACGTGVVAVTAARLGARVRGLDLSPALLDRAVLNAATADVAIDFTEGDVEALPYGDQEFDVVLSQFGHMFAPRPAVALAEMLRVLKPGGRIAFSTWPPELFTGRMFALVSRYLPPPPGVPAAIDWGDDRTVRERLGDAVRDIVFEIELQATPALSPAHYRLTVEATAAPVIKLVAALAAEPARLAEFRREFEHLIGLYLCRNAVRQHYLMTRAVKR